MGERSPHLVIAAGAVVAVMLSLGGTAVAEAGSRGSRAADAAAEARPTGPPALIAVLRRGRAPLYSGFDADGDYVAWTGERLASGSFDCAVHFLRISDRRQWAAGRACDIGTPGSVALNRSRAVWASVWGSNVESGAEILTATFGSRQSRSLGGGSRVCGEVGTANPDECDFEEPIVDSSGGSIVAQFQMGDPVSGGPPVMKTLVGHSVRDVPVTPGRRLAVHGGTIALVTREGLVELRRLTDGGLARRWKPVRRADNIALSQSLFASETIGRSGTSRRVDLYDTASGRLAVSISYTLPKDFPTELRSRLVADGVVFFAGRELRYMSRSGRSTVFATARGTPNSLAVVGHRVIWVERSQQREHLYLLKLRVTRH